MNIKIINDKIENCLSNEDCLYITLDYTHPIVKDGKIAYPVLNSWVEKTSIDTMLELKNKLPDFPKEFDEFSFVNIVYYKKTNELKLLLLQEPICLIKDKLSFNFKSNLPIYTLKDLNWNKELISLSFKSDLEKDDVDIVYSNYGINDNNGNLYFKKSDSINVFYEYVFINKIF
jgi:hypothetical protein